MRYAKTPEPAAQLALLLGLQPPTSYWLLPPSAAGCHATEFAAKQVPQNEAANAILPLPTLVVLPDLPPASLVGEHLRVLPAFHSGFSTQHSGLFHFPSTRFRRQFFTD